MSVFPVRYAGREDLVVLKDRESRSCGIAGGTRNPEGADSQVWVRV